jgi:hypothetical protein
MALGTVHHGSRRCYRGQVRGLLCAQHYFWFCFGEFHTIWSPSGSLSALSYAQKPCCLVQNISVFRQLWDFLSMFFIGPFYGSCTCFRTALDPEPVQQVDVLAVCVDI